MVNAAYMSKLFWDGHTASLETQAPSAAKGLAGNGKHDMMTARLTVVPEYVEMFTEAFGSARNPVNDAWRALSAFERTLTSTDSPIDEYLRGDTEALDEAQVRGMDLFNGKARCIMCHNGKLASDEKFYNLGLPRQPLFSNIAKNQIGFRSQNYGAGLTEDDFRNTKSDLGLYHRTHNHEDKGLFRTQPLRFIEYTPPYYHNGVMDDLYEVVEFYNGGGGDDYVLEDFGYSTKTKRLKKLDLTSDEIDDLVSFPRRVQRSRDPARNSDSAEAAGQSHDPIAETQPEETARSDSRKRLERGNDHEYWNQDPGNGRRRGRPRLSIEQATFLTGGRCRWGNDGDARSARMRDHAGAYDAPSAQAGSDVG